MTKKENSDKKKVVDLTGGAYQPSEKFEVIADGTVVRLENYEHPKSQEQLDKEKTERIKSLEVENKEQ